MRHTSSKSVYAYWRSLCQNRPVPLRRDLDPGAVRSLLPDLFILDAETGHPPIFRLAGTRLCLLLGREMRNCAFEDLWSPDSRQRGARATDRIIKAARPLLMTATGELRSGRLVDIELVMMPMASSPGQVDRIFGCLACLDRATMVEDPLLMLTLNEIFLADSRPGPESSAEVSAPLVRSVAVTSSLGAMMHKILHLKVFEGGRRD